MEILRVKHTLNITTDPKHASIIGASFSGLAAFYAGLKKPDRFGHVIVQSPALAAATGADRGCYHLLFSLLITMQKTVDLAVTSTLIVCL